MRGRARARDRDRDRGAPVLGHTVFNPARILVIPSSVPKGNGPCFGEFIDATVVFYQPTNGFRGSDRVGVRVKFGLVPPAVETTIFEELISISVRRPGPSRVAAAGQPLPDR